MAGRRLAIAGVAALAAAGLWLALRGAPERAVAPLGDVAADSADAPQTPDGMALATFAGGCFWCMEPPFDALPGVVSTTSGYSGGTVVNPTYAEVSAGSTGHAEVVQIAYDPRQISYAQLLEVFWKNIDPLARDSQFCDHGSQYRTAIYFHGEQQRRIAQKYFDALAASGRFSQPLQTELAAAAEFYAAEDYHQDYYKKNPVRYKYYRYACGRDQRLAELWGEGDERAAPLLAPQELGDPQTRAEPPGGAGLVAGRAEPGDDELLLRELLAQALAEEQLSEEERELLQQLIAQESELLEPDRGAEPGEPAPAGGAPERELTQQNR